MVRVDSIPDPLAPRSIPQTVVSHMAPGQSYSRAELCKALGLSPAEWTWAIRELKETGKVVLTGRRRGTRYAMQPSSTLPSTSRS